MKSTAEKLLDRHPNLIHSESKKVVSHEQRESESWILNTILVEGYDAPFKYKRKKRYKSLVGSPVNLTYYPTSEKVAGENFEIMKVVRIRRS